MIVLMLGGVHSLYVGYRTYGARGTREAKRELISFETIIFRSVTETALPHPVMVLHQWG